MPITTDALIQGWNEVVYATIETTIGTLIAPVAGSALKVKRATFGIKEKQRRVTDIKNTYRSFTEFVTGKRDVVDWEIQIPFKPISASIPPDADPLLEAFFGVAVASNVYTLTDALKTMTMYKHVTNHEQYIYGAICNKLLLEFGNGASPSFTFSGQAIKGARGGAFQITTNGINTLVACSVIVKSPGIGALTDIDLYYQIDSEVVKVSSLTEAQMLNSKIATIARAQFSTSAAKHTTNATDATPYMPTPSYANTSGGQALGEQQGTLTVDSTTLKVVGGSLELNNGNVYVDDHNYGSELAEDIRKGKFDGVLSIRVKSHTRSNWLYNYAKRNKNFAIQLDVGDTSGKTLRVAAANCEILDQYQSDFEGDNESIHEIPIKLKSTTSINAVTSFDFSI